MKASSRPKKLSTYNARSKPRPTKNENRKRKELGVFDPAIPTMQSDPFWPPLSDPLAERQILEGVGPGEWVDWLQKRVKVKVLVSHPRVEARRIAEVYRLCFELSGNENVSIIGDFVAHYPRIVMSGTWVAEAAEQWNVTKLDETNRTGTNRLLKAIADGFRRASSTSWNLQQRRGRLRAAREVRLRMGTELKSFLEALRTKDSTKDWLAEQIAARVSDLVRDNPRLSSVAEKLRTELSARRAYRAAILIAATLFEVRERDLQSKSNQLRTATFSREK